MPEPIDDGYPVVLRLTGRPVVVVGGGTIALRKVQGLLEAGASVTVVSPAIVDELRALAGVAVRLRRYEPSDLDGAWLVIAATNDAAVQQQIADEGARRRIFVNSVDDPDRCSFILPAIARRGPVIVAVSTQGRSPALAGRLRDRLADALPPDLEQIVDTIAEARRAVHAQGRSTEVVDWTDRLSRL